MPQERNDYEKQENKNRSFSDNYRREQRDGTAETLRYISILIMLSEIEELVKPGIHYFINGIQYFADAFFI